MKIEDMLNEVEELKKKTEILEQIVDLKERLKKLEITVTKDWCYPTYPVYPTWPGYPQPYTGDPWYQPNTTWCSTGVIFNNEFQYKIIVS